jgi:hypothetical protein
LVRRTFLVISALSAVLGVACGSFSEGNGAGNDAGVDAGDARPPELDGGDAGATTTTRCPGTTRIRESFDGAVNLAGWSLASGAVISSGKDGRPPPSLFAEVAANQKKDNTLQRFVDVAGHAFVCIEFDLRFDEKPGGFTGNAYAEVLEVRGIGFVVFVERRAEGFSFVPGSGVAATPLIGFAPGTWQHVVVKIPFGGGGQPTGEIDGFAGVFGPNAAPAQTSPIAITFGLEADPREGSGAGVAVHLDNFHLTSDP